MTGKPNRAVFAYAIRDRETGRYSRGGNPPVFAKCGKTWPTEGALRSHLRMLLDGPFFTGGIPAKWEVVPLFLAEPAEGGLLPAADFYAAGEHTKAAKAAKAG